MAGVINGRLLVFGGRGDPDGTGNGGPYLNDIWELDPGAERYVRLTSTPAVLAHVCLV